MISVSEDRLCDEIVQRTLAGERLSPHDAVQLLATGDLLLLASAADEVRRRRYPNNYATFIIDRNINYTNVCLNGCGFCAFYRDMRHPDAYLLTADEILERVEEATKEGATQIMLQGGLHPKTPVGYFEEVFSTIKSRFPTVTVHSLSPAEVIHVSKLSRLSLPETVARLKAAGLDSMPGGGAEILVDSVRRAIGRKFPMSSAWLGAMEEAHNQGLRTTATMMMGSLETLEDRVEHLRLIRSLQDKAGSDSGFRAFIPWKYQPGNTKLGGHVTSSLDYLRTLAVSRLFLDNIEHIQGGWLTPGKDVGQISLSFGADDFGSIMLEENVVRAAGVRRQITTEEMCRLIRAADRVPALRDTSFTILQVFGEQ